nr:GNAT family N-acetyltransferase [Rothia sp. ZJ1223]
MRVICVSTEKVLGVCSFGSDRENPLVGEIYALYLSPTFIGKGLDRLLRQDAIARLAEAGFKQVNLWVLEGNAQAIRFYERAGLSLTGRAKTEKLGEVNLWELHMSLSIDVS